MVKNERAAQSKGIKFAAEPRSDRLVLSTCADEKRSRDKCMAATAAASPAPAG
jgi:hypothetical protein